MSSKSILTILSYTVSKFVRFFETQCIPYTTLFLLGPPTAAILTPVNGELMCRVTPTDRRQNAPQNASNLVYQNLKKIQESLSRTYIH